MRDEPVGAWRLFRDVFALYRRHAVLFLVLASAAIVPYRLIVIAVELAVGGGGGTAPSVLLGGLRLLDLLLILPLVLALHVQAVAAIRVGEDLELRQIGRRGLVALPAVAIPTALAGIGILLGTAFFIIPGVLLLVRWAVVPQAAAIEREGVFAPLRRSAQLGRGSFRHVLLFVVLILAVTYVLPFGLLWLASGGWNGGAISTVAGIVVTVLAISFGAVATALLYYDLRLRHSLRPVATTTHKTAIAAPPGGEHRPRQASWDPRAYTDENRPAGWYVVPAMPERMGYWNDGDPPRWAGRTRTPRKILDAWRAELPEG